MRVTRWLIGGSAWLLLAAVPGAQLGDSSFTRLDHPAIDYLTRPPHDPVALLNAEIQRGERTLAFSDAQGYLPAVLAALDIPVQSQVVVFSKTSIQLNLINAHNPRALYFNDAASVGWMHGTFVLEIAAQDPVLGTVFYELDQQRVEKPTFRQTRACLRCHHSLYTSGVPGRLVRSMPTAADGTVLASAKNLATDHRTPYDQRWGGWFVTGHMSGMSHLGNRVGTPGLTSVPPPSPALDTLAGVFDTTRYLSPHSDVVALMVLEHQGHVMNLLTRLGWEMRAAAYERQAGSVTPAGRPPFSFEAAVNEAVDYLLFVDEAPLPERVQGTSGFAEEFARRGPFDRQGRSLRDLDLQRRLMRYPCSFIIYSPMFDALPDEAREAIYRRLWQILSGGDRSPRYARLSTSDRSAIVEILRDTRSGLPDYFGP